MVGMIHSSYYRVPSLGRKGNKASLYTHHQAKGWVTQEAVIDAVKKFLTRIYRWWLSSNERLLTARWLSNQS